MKISRTPAATTPATICSRIGLSDTRSIGLGNSLVSSLMRVPLPAARMTAFISTTDEHRWTRMKNKYDAQVHALHRLGGSADAADHPALHGRMHFQIFDFVRSHAVFQ